MGGRTTLTAAKDALPALADDLDRGAAIVYRDHPGIAAMMQVAAMVIRERQPPESIVTPRKEKRGSY